MSGCLVPLIWQVVVGCGMVGRGIDPPSVAADPRRQATEAIRAAVQELQEERTKLTSAAAVDRTPAGVQRSLQEAAAFNRKWAERTFGLAEKYRGEPEIVALLDWIFVDNYARIAPTMENRAILLRAIRIVHDGLSEVKEVRCLCHYLCEPQVAALPEASELLRRLMRLNPHASVQGVSRLALAVILQDKSEDFRCAAAEREKFTTEATGLLKDVAAKYADITDWQNGSGPIGRMAEDRLFELAHLSVGKVAPDIRGTDLQGQRLTLREYRGSIVMLDFWQIH